MNDEELEELIEQTVDQVERHVCSRHPTEIDYQKAGKAVQNAIETAVRRGWKPKTTETPS